MSHTNTNFPAPPYSYNDYRITYNEPCFLYNGGFDLICLTIRHPGGTGASSAVGKYPTERSYPSEDMINFVFKVCIEYVNDKKYDQEEYCEIKRYSVPKDSNVSVKTTSLNVTKRLLSISSDEFSVRTIEKFLSASNPIVKEDSSNKKTVVSSSLNKLKTYVSSSLQFNKPRKIKVNSTTIFKDDKNKDGNK